MDTGGLFASSPFSRGSVQQLADASGQLSADLAVTPSNANSFTTNAGFYTIGGVGVSSFTTMAESFASNNSPGASSVSDTFTVTQESLVVFVAMAGGQSRLTLSGILNLQVDSQVGAIAGVIGMTIAHANLPPGTYTVTENSFPAQAAGQDPNHMADLIGVFVFNGAAQLGPAGPNNQQQTWAEPVSTGNGNYYYQHVDVSLPGRGLGLTFQRCYNSLDDYAGPLGTNWTHTYNVFLTQDSIGNVTIKWGDGHAETFMLSGANYTPPLGVFSKLTKDVTGTFRVTRKDQTEFAFSAGGKLTSIQDKNSNTVLMTYNGSGNLRQVTNSAGRSLIFSYDGSNRVTQIVDPVGRTLSFQYDGSNDLTQVTDPSGGATTYSYDWNHRVTTILLPNGQTLLQNAYDSFGRVVTQTGGRGFSATLKYGVPSPLETTITDARGGQTIHSYDSSLRIVKIIDAAGGITSFTYDANNDRASVTNQNGDTTAFSHDSAGNVTQITDPLGHSSAFTYDARNDLLTAANPKGKVTTFTYNPNGNLTGIQNTIGGTATLAYDGFGELTARTDPRGNTTNLSYDSNGDLTGVKDALGRTTALGRDGVGRLVSITDPNGHTSTASYDLLNRLVSIADALGNQTRLAYDAVGNLLKVTDANRNATNYAYDATNDVVTVTDAMGHITRYGYDPNNNRVSFTNAKSNATAYAYDALNRLVRITDPLAFATSYAYNPVGNVVSTMDAKGQTNVFGYDALNRLVSINYADGKSVAYSHDADGNRLSMIDSHGTTTYAYDALDRLVSVNNPGGKVVAYSYDAAGNRQSLTYPDGKLLSYAYDADNRLSSVKDWVGRVTSYDYDPAGNLLAVLYPNHAAVDFEYDAAGRLVEVRNRFRNAEEDGKEREGSADAIARFRYALDHVGNRIEVTDGSGRTTRYGYDPLYELTSVIQGDTDDREEREGRRKRFTRFVYDEVGNRLKMKEGDRTVEYSYDAADRLLKAGTTTFAYDANGNQISRTQSAPAMPILYSYDAANRLTAVLGGIYTSSFAYDGDGNRFSQSTHAGTYNYLNDVATSLPVVLQESGPDGNISYARGLGLISESNASFDSFYQYDGLGSVVGVSDLKGRLSAQYAYDAWGEASPREVEGEIPEQNKFRFTGEALDRGTQLYYLRARYYDPSVGRFLSADTLLGFARIPISHNGYIYAYDNPVGLLDPSGHDAWGEIWGAVAGDVAWQRAKEPGSAPNAIDVIASGIETGLGLFCGAVVSTVPGVGPEAAAEADAACTSAGSLAYNAGVAVGGGKVDWPAVITTTAVSAAFSFLPPVKGFVNAFLTSFGEGVISNAAGQDIPFANSPPRTSSGNAGPFTYSGMTLGGIALPVPGALGSSGVGGSGAGAGK